MFRRPAVAALRHPRLLSTAFLTSHTPAHTRGLSTNPWERGLQAIRNKEWHRDLSIDEQLQLALAHAKRNKLITRLQAEHGDDWDWMLDAMDLEDQNPTTATATAAAAAAATTTAAAAEHAEKLEKHLRMLVRAKRLKYRRRDKAPSGKRQLGLMREAILVVIQEHALDPTDTPKDFLLRYKSEIDEEYLKFSRLYRAVQRMRAIDVVLQKYAIDPARTPKNFLSMYADQINHAYMNLLKASSDSEISGSMGSEETPQPCVPHPKHPLSTNDRDTQPWNQMPCYGPAAKTT